MTAYLKLLHGRDDPNQEMHDWGFSGPVLGPFEAVHFTYRDHIRCIRNIETDEVLELGFTDDMLTYEGKYYGDFEIADDFGDVPAKTALCGSPQPPTNYTAEFRTDVNFATYDFKARSPQDALKKARAFCDERSEELMFEHYTGAHPVNEIAVNNDAGDEVALWQDDDLRVRLAAHDLLDAGELALRELRGFYSDRESEAVRVLVEAIAKAKGGQP